MRSARSQARSADAEYADPPVVYQIGQRVRCDAGIGVIEFIAHSNAMDSPLYTVAIDTRLKLRLLPRDLRPV
jgi:hypothetical protein